MSISRCQWFVLVSCFFILSCSGGHDKKLPEKDGIALKPGSSAPSRAPDPDADPSSSPDSTATASPRCALPKTAKTFTLTPTVTANKDQTPRVYLTDFKDSLNAACQSCHLAPALSTGDFSYQNQLHASEIIVDGAKKTVPGYFEAAEAMRDQLLAGTMPPENIKNKNPDLYKNLGNLLDQWIKDGKPEAPAPGEASGGYPAAMWGDLSHNQWSDLGNCLPASGSEIGTDPTSDYYFDQAATLPTLLTDTDLTSMDSTVLAKKGTVAYDVEYPLWNDHVQKQRYIHQPARIASGKSFAPKPLAIVVKDKFTEPTFDIPENTRFYKTFFRGVKGVDGQVRFKPVETRIIVARNPPRKPLFGTYVWRDDGSNADLLQEPYRDGTPWKDHVVSIDFDQAAGTKRNYLVPARHRCEQCHRGAQGENYVLGFTPLQINRRDVGEAGRDLPVAEDELNQVRRFVSYGMLTSQTAAALPKLEYFPSSHILDDHTVRAQGYMVGNCSHCHNPKGYAFTEGKISMNLSAGKIFDFDTHLTSSFYTNKKLVNQDGKLDQSYLFHRVADSDADLKLENRMPLHSIASPDCRVVDLFAKWIKTYDASLNAYDLDTFKVANSCTNDADYGSGDIAVLEQDPTEATGPYKPRRPDWNDPASGMSDWFKSLRMDDALAKLIKKSYAVDWWQVKTQCSFPTDATVAADDLKDWMLKPGTKDPARPLGQLYWTSAGAYFFNLTCVKCHGRLGEGDGPLASNLNQWSGGTIRVANFRQGLFGQDGDNLKQFLQVIDGTEADLSPNYFIWMAYEGTKMNPPAQVADLLGTNKAQMLKTLIDRCARQIPTNPKAAKPYFRDYDVFNDICTKGNWPVTDERLQYDPDSGDPLHPDELEKWLKQSASNLGFAIYDYVRGSLAIGKQQYPQTECENVFGR